MWGGVAEWIPYTTVPLPAPARVGVDGVPLRACARFLIAGLARPTPRISHNLVRCNALQGAVSTKYCSVAVYVVLLKHQFE